MRKLAHSTELWKTFCSWPQRKTFSNCRRPLEERNWEECTKKVTILKLNMSVSYWEGFCWGLRWVLFHLSKGDSSSGSMVALSVQMRRRKTYCCFQNHQSDVCCWMLEHVHITTLFFGTHHWHSFPAAWRMLAGGADDVLKSNKMTERNDKSVMTKAEWVQSVWPTILCILHKPWGKKERKEGNGKGSWFQKGNKR